MKRFVIGALLASLAAPASAQEPSLGRLFLTPEQRAALDNARRNKIRAEAIAATPVEKKPKPPATRSVMINGIVQRSDGESVIWVNGKATDGQMTDGMRVGVSPASQGAVVVHEPNRGRRVELRVGQRADLLTGRVDEAHERKRKAAAQSNAQKMPRATGKRLRAADRAGEGADDRIPRDDSRDEPQADEEKSAQ